MHTLLGRETTSHVVLGAGGGEENVDFDLRGHSLSVRRVTQDMVGAAVALPAKKIKQEL